MLFHRPAFIIPRQLPATDLAESRQEGGSAVGEEETGPHPSQEEIVEPDDLLGTGRPPQLGPEVGRARDRLELSRARVRDDGRGRAPVPPDKAAGRSGVEASRGRKVGPVRAEDASVGADARQGREPPAEELQGIERDEAKRRQLAARHRQESRLLPEDVVTALLGRPRLSRSDHGPHSREARDRVPRRERERGKGRPCRLEEVGGFRRRDGWLLVERRRVVEVRRSEEREAFPRVGEQGPTVERVAKGHRLRRRKAPGREEEVASAQRTDPGPASHLSAQAVGPGAGGVHDGRGPHLALLPPDEVPQDRAGDGSLLPEETLAADVVQGLRTFGLGLEEDAQDEPGVVGRGVRVGEAPFEARRPGVRGAEEELLARQASVPPPSSDEVVHDEARPDQGAARAVALVQGEEKADLLDKPGRLRQQPVPLAHRFPGQLHVSLPRGSEGHRGRAWRNGSTCRRRSPPARRGGPTDPHAPPRERCRLR